METPIEIIWGWLLITTHAYVLGWHFCRNYVWWSSFAMQFLAITSISGQKKGSKIQISPQFYSKNDPEKPPHLVWGFFTFQYFAFFLIVAFSSLSFSSFPLLLDFLKPKSGPSNEVIGNFFFSNFAVILVFPSSSFEVSILACLLALECVLSFPRRLSGSTLA